MAKKKDDRKAKKDAWRAKKTELRENDVFRLDRPITLVEAQKLAAREVAKLHPREREEFHRRVVQAFADAEDPEDGTTDKVARINFTSIAADVRRDLRPQPDVSLYEGQTRGTEEEQSVESYLEFLSHTLQMSRDRSQKWTDTQRAVAMRAYTSLREARVFHIGKETYGAIHEEADRHTTALAGVPFQYPDVRVPVPDDERKRYLQTFYRESKNQPFPDPLPFSAIFLGYGNGVFYPDKTWDRVVPSALQGRIVKLWLAGHLLDSAGLACVCLKGETDAGTVATWLNDSHMPEGGWVRGLDLEPWTLPHLIRIINDHRTFVMETEVSKPLKSAIRLNRKKLGIEDFKHMPIPFYSLRLQSHVIKEKVRVQLGRPATPKRYKTDVRGHERCRIRRGSLPIAPDLAEKLIQRGYVIFSSNKLDEETYRRLSERGLGYKRADEWLAVKATWVKEHMTSNDPKLPYIPALRVAGKIRTPKKATGGWTDDPAAR